MFIKADMNLMRLGFTSLWYFQTSCRPPCAAKCALIRTIYWSQWAAGISEQI